MMRIVVVTPAVVKLKLDSEIAIYCGIAIENRRRLVAVIVDCVIVEWSAVAIITVRFGVAILGAIHVVVVNDNSAVAATCIITLIAFHAQPSVVIAEVIIVPHSYVAFFTDACFVVATAGTQKFAVKFDAFISGVDFPADMAMHRFHD